MGVSSAVRTRPGSTPGGIEEPGEDVQPRTVDGVGDECFVGDVGGFDPLLLRQRMVHRKGHLGFVAEQRQVGEPGLLDGVGGNDQVEVAPQQGGQRLEMEAARDVQFHLRPVLPVGVDGGKQPFEAAMAFDGHVQTARMPAGEPGKV